MFEDFEEFDIACSSTTIHGRRGGDGPPLLLLHGIPETHLMWHRIAPPLAAEFSIVATDLRGFGDSGKPASTDDHSPYAMRQLAQDQVEVMQQLGHERYGVIGHDRGARCAYRMALDHPQTVASLSVLDIVPTGDAFGRADMNFSLGFWVWSFLAAPYPGPERLIERAPAILVNHMLDTWSSTPEAFPTAVRERYIEQFSDPDTIHAICEQYRAAAIIDFQHDEADHGRAKIACPTLALWGQHGPVEAWYDPLKIWAQWADDVRGRPIESGHFLPEEAPDIVLNELRQFLDSQGH
jgi:haloacetate dehalogenase